MERKPRATVPLAVTSPYHVTETKSGRELAGPQERLDRCDVRAAPGGGIQLGERTLASGDVVIQPVRDASIVLDDKTYRGLLRIQRTPEGLVFTNHVDVVAYLRGVLRGELPRSFHAESFKAQAVAARTYALYMRAQTPKGRTFDVTDDESSQVYEGVQAEEAGAVAAAEATYGEVCVWGESAKAAMFCTYYSSSCGGLSQHVNNVKPRDPDVPPLAGGVACDDCQSARHYRWGPVTISKAEVTKRLIARYPSLRKLGTIMAVRPKELTSDGRIVRIDSNASNVTYDLRGLTIMPGWIDPHTHIAAHFDRETGKVHSPQVNETPQQAMLYAMENAYKTFMARVTPIQRPGAQLDKDLRDWIADGRIAGPRILTSLRSVTNQTGDPSHIRAFVRREFAEHGKLVSTVLPGKGDEPTKFEQYYKFAEAVKTIPSHRFLAIRRG